MPVVMLDKNMNVRLTQCDSSLQSTFSSIVGFEDGEYYPEKNSDQRVRRERPPVSISPKSINVNYVLI